MDTWISINRQIIAKNTKNGTNDPPIRIAQGKRGKPIYAHRALINGPVVLIYEANDPILPCGARLAIKTNSPVRAKIGKKRVWVFPK